MIFLLLTVPSSSIRELLITNKSAMTCQLSLFIDIVAGQDHCLCPSLGNLHSPSPNCEGYQGGSFHVRYNSYLGLRFEVSGSSSDRDLPSASEMQTRATAVACTASGKSQCSQTNAREGVVSCLALQFCQIVCGTWKIFVSHVGKLCQKYIYMYIKDFMNYM